MSADLHCWIEYDAIENPPFASSNVDWECVHLDEWFDLLGNKDYKFMGAISGIRNESKIPPLIPLRGCPPNPGHQVRRYMQDFGENIGWLFPHEVHVAIEHHGLRLDDLSVEVQTVITMLDFLASRIGRDRVRFVFGITD